MKNHKDFLKLIIDLKINSKFAFQARFEMMDDETIELSKSVNCHYEFGIQTLNENEEKIIQRRNNKKKIIDVMRKLNKNGISYEMSIIYGIPGQNYDTFLQSVDFLTTFGNDNIKMFPLGLLRGTPIYENRDLYKLKTVQLSRFDTPVVIESYSFNFKEWQKMFMFANNFKNIQLCKKSLL